MHWKLVLGLAGGMLVYILAGAGVFHALEHENEEETVVDLKGTYQEFLDANPCLDSAEFEQLVKSVIKAYDAGVTLTPSEESAEPNWSFKQAIWFVLTVVTTVGYGNISPSTAGGQIFFIFYAIIGIPFMLFLLAELGKRYSAINKRLCDFMSCFKNPKVDAFFDTLVIIVLGLTLVIVLPSVLFMYVEDWSYREAVYYSVVTLSTVGFGDYVTGMQMAGTGGGFYHVFCYAWLFVGLAWFAGVISNIQDKIGDRVETAEEKTNQIRPVGENDTQAQEGTSSTEEYIYAGNDETDTYKLDNVSKGNISQNKDKIEEEIGNENSNNNHAVYTLPSTGGVNAAVVDMSESNGHTTKL